MRRLAHAAAIALAFGPGPLLAQSDHTPDSYGTWINEQFRAIAQRFYAGEREAAYAEARALDAETSAYVDWMGDDERIWYPDLLVARLAYSLNRYDEVARAAAPVVTALDRPGARLGFARMEAMYRLSLALYHAEAYAQAEPVMRAFLTQSDTAEAEAREVWKTETAYMLAITLTRNGAADAQKMRQSLISDFLDREGATDGLYLRLWQIDLQDRRRDGKQSDRLLQDARKVADFIEASDEGEMAEYNELYATLARIFADHEDFARALPILNARMGWMRAAAPGSEDYFWSAQNLAGIHNLRRDYPAALNRANEALGELDVHPQGRSDAFANVRSSLEQVIYVAASQLGEMRISQEALQRAYVATRQTNPANNSEAMLLGRSIQAAFVDPTVFPYAAELGLDRQLDLTLTEYGEGVISLFFAGRYRQLRTILLRAENQTDLDQTMVALNRAFFHALMGEIGPGEEALAKVRAAQRRPVPGALLPADSFAPDLAEALLYTFSRNWRPGKADSALARLERRQDLNETTIAVVKLLRATQADNRGDKATAQRLYSELTEGEQSAGGTDAWGVIMGMGLLNLALVLDDLDRARDFVPRFSEQLEATGEHGLALVSTQMFALNADPEAMLTERSFQTMAFHIRALSAMLPDEHQWVVAAKVAFANGLGQRGEWDAAATLMGKALDSHRASPWHRREIAGFIRILQAWMLWNGGQPDLAQSMIAQVYETREGLDWTPFYWTEMIFAQTFSLSWRNQLDAARTVMDEALAKRAMIARLYPPEATRLYTMNGELWSRMERPVEAQAAFDAAVAAIPYDGFAGGAPLANTLRQRAFFLSGQGQTAAAYTDMARSNGLWFDFYERSATGSNEVARNTTFDRTRAVEEARLGWAFAQELKGDAD